MPLVLIPLLMKLVELGIDTFAPALLGAAKLEIDKLGGAPLNADEQTRIDDAVKVARALEETHAALMAAEPAP